ncbi:hypothetical protein P153DRAFT_398807 [Dothidotthia symphoricarpi CBS 119687]|uniref:Uncharacterized protein n=1 Tax=Dothidotthia symphoricarpi CBS 119687 TaxID=1392245 RepID=A0A6A6A3V5_9PLEO|nr:uncharacterized protein P153DRAFT_398807 [Dothidotthia symphoricarpi CBS 119687]KAF2126692.1 hypothetical protein P153DRAFT_398807 [Dothidotthia symphoricarpi CBS 119687]
MTTSSEDFFCPRNGAQWYACTTGTLFVGCCKISPCEYGCSGEDLAAVSFKPETMGTFPDGSCYDHNVNFWSVSTFATINQRATFWGCCASNPAYNGYCPQGDLRPAHLRKEDLDSIYTSTNISRVPAVDPPSVTSSIRKAQSPPVTYSWDEQLFNTKKINRPNATISIGVSGALIIGLCALLGLWVCLRRPKKVSKDSRPSAESIAFHPKAETSSGISDALLTTDQSRTPPRLHELSRLGTKTLYVLLSTSIIILILLGFLACLWFGNASNKTWKKIMITNWATRSVSITALFLRTAIDFQAAIGSAIIASLLLESNTGTHLFHLASLSPMRAGTSNPWSLGQLMVEEMWLTTAKQRKNHLCYIIALLLLATTSTLQFSSTLLLSDLKPGSLSGNAVETEVRPSLSYMNISERIPRDAAWTTNPPFYPTFGEHSSPVKDIENGITDTGVLLRTFLPYATANSRQTLHSYTGNGLVLDARVSCQAPLITQFNGTEHYSQLQGTVETTKNSTMLQTIYPTSFDCAVAGLNDYSICQVGQPYPGFIGSLNSHFMRSTSYGTAFLVIKGSNPTTIKSNDINNTATNSEWIDLVFANATGVGASMSLCFAPWDAAVLNITLSSTANRTEPQLAWWGSFITSDILNYLLPQSTQSKHLRRVLQMSPPQSLSGDLPPPKERPFIQSDASGSSATQDGSNTPLPQDWSIFMTQKPLPAVINNFSKRPSQAIAADPALGAIFTDTLAANHSVAWALSSVITILSMTNYYSQQPAFDRLDTAKVSFFSDVPYPRDYVGFMLLTWALVAHFLLMAILLVLFVTRTHLTLLGNAWPAFAQLAESPQLKEHMTNATLKNDGEILKAMRAKGKDRVRVRVVHKGDGAEVVTD